MKIKAIFLGAFLIVIAMSGNVAAGLVEYGLSNEMFFDTTLDLYFYDPHEFQGQRRGEVDTWLASHPIWRYAAPKEISHLLSNNLPVGDPAGTDWMIMGDPTSQGAYETASGSMRYLHHWSGWMEDTPRDPDYWPHNDHADWATLTMGYNIPTAGQDGTYADFALGYDYGEYAVGGAWLVTDVDPLSTPIPTTLVLLGSGILGLSTFKRRKKEKAPK